MALETEIKQLKEIMDTLSENQKLNFTLSVFASSQSRFRERTL